MLSAEIIQKIRKIHIRAGRQVDSVMAGQYRSVFRGAGIEFEEVREYFPGDEVKSIDWKVSARLGRPFVKRYREERELLMMLLVDMSGSESFGTRENLKRETAAEAASILAFNAIRNNDKVGAILFTDKVEGYIPPKKGAAHVWRVIREMFAFTPAGPGTDIGAAVRFLGRVTRKRSIAFLISDFLEPDQIGIRAQTLKGLGAISRKHELIGMMVTDPGEFTLPGGGMVQMEDLETGERLWIDASDKAGREFFEKQMIAGCRMRMDALKRANIDCVEISTAGAVADALTRYFRMREKMRR